MSMTPHDEATGQLWADLAAAQAVLDKYGITQEALEQHAQAKADAIAAGDVVPISRKKKGLHQ